MEPATLIRDYKLNPVDHNLVKMPKGALILEVCYKETHHVVLTVQCLRAFTFDDLEERHFRIFETGQDLPNVGLVYTGSYHVPHENQNYYLYEDFNTQKEKPSGKDFSSRQKTAIRIAQDNLNPFPVDGLKLVTRINDPDDVYEWEAFIIGVNVNSGKGHSEHEALDNYDNNLGDYFNQITGTYGAFCTGSIPLATSEEQAVPHILSEVKQVIWDKIKVLMYDDKKEKHQSFECSVDVASLGIHNLDIEKGYGYDEQEAFADYMKGLETHQAQINNLVAMLKAKQCDVVPIGGDGKPLKTTGSI